jgi:hypothetical protein
MTYLEIVAEIQRLSLDERLRLLDVLTRSVRDALQGKSSEQIPVEQVLGLLQSDGPPPSDAEVSEAYVRYLTEKYA